MCTRMLSRKLWTMYCLLSLVGFLSIVATSLMLWPASKTPIERFKPCIQTVAGPNSLYLCSNGRGYSHQGADWIDLGSITPVPQVPGR